LQNKQIVLKEACDSKLKLIKYKQNQGHGQ